MSFIELLGKQLKHDDVLELLEYYEIPVIYDFDRTHEGIDDCYWAAAEKHGFQLGFDQRQLLHVIFLYIVNREGFTPIDQSLIDVPIYETFDAALSACEENGISYITNPGPFNSENPKWWLKCVSGAHTVHYEYRDENLIMITLSIYSDS